MILHAVTLRPRSAPPPGIDAVAYNDALLQDSFDLLDDLNGVTASISDAAAPYDALASLKGDIGAVITGDAPDLPGLLVGKLIGACEDRQAGVLPSDDGTLVGIATRLPVPDWLRAITLDDGLDAIHERAPRNSVSVGPGWHRLRKPEDIHKLDPRLDGWHATRTLLYDGSSSPRT
jgi:hypothetical protein